MKVFTIQAALTQDRSGLPVVNRKLCSCLAGMQPSVNAKAKHPVAPLNRRRNLMGSMCAGPSVPKTRAAGAPVAPSVPESSLATGMLHC